MEIKEIRSADLRARKLAGALGKAGAENSHLVRCLQGGQPGRKTPGENCSRGKGFVGAYTAEGAGTQRRKGGRYRTRKTRLDGNRGAPRARGRGEERTDRVAGWE